MIDEKFFGTKWNAFQWTLEDKKKWQEKFDFTYGNGDGAFSSGAFDFAYINQSGEVQYDKGDRLGYFDAHPYKEMNIQDVFPLNPETGMKFDTDKPMYNLIPANAIDELAKVLTFGAEKYAPNSWQDVPDGMERYRAALLRHAFAIQRGEIYDQETGLPHSAHIMCNAAFITELQMKGEK